MQCAQWPQRASRSTNLPDKQTFVAACSPLPANVVNCMDPDKGRRDPCKTVIKEAETAHKETLKKLEALMKSNS